MNFFVCRWAVLAALALCLIGCDRESGSNPFVPPAGGTVAGTWEWRNPRPLGNDLNAICMLDAQNGWAVGASGAILATTDGGDTWTIHPSGTDIDLRRLHFRSPQEGWILGWMEAG